MDFPSWGWELCFVGLHCLQWLMRFRSMANFKHIVTRTAKGNTTIWGSIAAAEMYVIIAETFPMYCVWIMQTGSSSPFPFYNQYIGFHPVLKLLCIILVAVFIGGYYYFPATTSSVLMRFRSMANFKHIVTRTAKGNTTMSKLRSYFKKEYQTFFRNPVYVINGLFGICFICPF